MREISSHVFHPTFPIQIWFVPGRTVKRKGLRSPYPTMRCAFGSELLYSGFVGSALPVDGSTRMIVPLSSLGSVAARRRLNERSAPPSAVGGDSVPPTPAGGSPQRLSLSPAYVLPN